MTDREAPESDANQPSWVDRAILPFVFEPTLWPVLLVVIGHAIAFVTPALLWALRDGRPAAQAALLLLGLFTVRTLQFEMGRQRRPGALTAIWAAIWALSGVLAVVAHRYNAL